MKETLFPTTEWRWVYLFGADYRTTTGRILTDGRITRAIREEPFGFFLEQGPGYWKPRDVWFNRNSRPLGVDLSIDRLEDLQLREGEALWEPAEVAWRHDRPAYSWSHAASEGPATRDGRMVLNAMYYPEVARGLGWNCLRPRD